MRTIVVFAVKSGQKLTIAVLVSLLALTPLTGTSLADELGGWADGALPQMVVGDETEGAPPPTCIPQTMTYYSYRNPNGTVNDLGRVVQTDACVTYNGLGGFGTSNGHYYVLPYGDMGYRFLNTSARDDVFLPVPNQSLFIYRPVGPVNTGRALRFYDSLAAAGNFKRVDGNIYERAFQIESPVAPALRDSQNSIVYMRSGFAFSENGEWMLFEAHATGFVRVNTKTREMTLINTEKYTYGQGYSRFYQLAISNDGNSVISTYTDTMGSSKEIIVYDLTDCHPTPFVAAGTNQIPEGCRSRKVRQSISNQIGPFDGLTQMKFSPDGKSITGKLWRTEGGASKYYRFTYSVAGYTPPPSLAYLALGDSFSSGEGEMDDRYYLAATNTHENKCHVSIRSYPYVVANALVLGNGFHNVACSGAKYEPDYGGRAQYGQGSSPAWLAGSKEQADFLREARPDVVTISMIGNDIDFSGKIKRCLMPDSCFTLLNERKTAADEINRKFNKLVALYNDIKISSGGARVYVLGYPKLFSPTVGCNKFNVGLDIQEQIVANNLTSYLNATIKAATEKAGVVYIDVEDAFVGKRLCDNGVIAVNGVSKKGTESFHPNNEGHKIMAQVLRVQSNDFQLAMPEPNNAAHAPTTDSAVYTDLMNGADPGGIFSIATYGDLVNDILYRGVTYIVENPKIMLLNTLSAFQVWLNSEPVYLGDLATNELGQLTGEITIPEGVEPGYHTLHIYARDITGQDVDVYKTVFVGASENDYDGDGIPNDDEQCLLVQPVGVDDDRDGIDDACDVEIGELPTDNTPPVVVGLPDREPNTAGWYNGDVTIHWTASDPEPSSGEPTQPDPTIASLEGVNTYTSADSCDPLNNCANGSLELKIDKTAPTLGSAAWSCIILCKAKNLTLTIPVSDNLSGIANVEYFIDQGAPMSATVENGTVKIGLADLPNGTHTITVRAQDTAGNWSAPTVETAVVITLLGQKLVTKQLTVITVLQMIIDYIRRYL